VVEVVIRHSKNECRLGKNYLLGTEGDKINALLCGWATISADYSGFLFFGFTKFFLPDRSTAQPT
jgi:hypothetical protein